MATKRPRKRRATHSKTTRHKPARARAPAERGRDRARPLEFNHAMIYTSDYARALVFYRDQLGFRLLDEYPGGYGRLQSPGGQTTIAIHKLEEGKQMEPARAGIRLYFEIRDLDDFCGRLKQKGVSFDQMPQDMPWGWRHAYLRDPDGHELSLYWAGKARFAPTSIRGSR